MPTCQPNTSKHDLSTQPTYKTAEIGSGPGRRVYSAELDETGEVEVVLTCEGMVQAMILPRSDVPRLVALLSSL